MVGPDYLGPYTSSGRTRRRRHGATSATPGGLLRIPGSPSRLYKCTPTAPKWGSGPPPLIPLLRKTLDSSNSARLPEDKVVKASRKCLVFQGLSNDPTNNYFAPRSWSRGGWAPYFRSRIPGGLGPRSMVQVLWTRYLFLEAVVIKSSRGGQV